MSLYWPDDAAAVVNDAPRLHALVIGVGAYEHLGLGVAKPATFLTGLAPLTTTAPAARRIARWLESDYANPGCQLGSIELLLSPAERLQRADGADVDVERAGMAEIKAAFGRWFQRLNADPGNIAFFYFAGHGISTISQFLLPADFGDPDHPDDWENCIDASQMKSGMFKCKAQTQLFFFDACRDRPIEALLQRNPHGDPLVTASASDRVDVSAAYSAASEGRKAYGRENEETFFCKALIQCLEGVGARKAGPQWQVDTASLSSALASVMDVFADIEDEPLSSECSVQKPAPLHFPADGSVLVKVDCVSDRARDEASIEVRQAAGVLSSPAGERRPWMATARSGAARIEVSFQSFGPEAIDDHLAPPTYEWEVPL